MKRNLDSIASSLRRLVWILCVPSVIISLFLIFFTAIFVKEEIEALQFDPDEYNYVDLVVAKTNLVAGTVMSKTNLGVSAFARRLIDADEFIFPDDAKVLFGHKIMRDLKTGKPISWEHTDIMITNSISQQPD